MKESLSVFPFFSQLSKRDVDALLKGLPRKQFKNGDKILKQGQPCTEAHLLIEGKVEVTTTGPRGAEVHILLHQAPSLFGIIEIWREARHLGNVVAMGPCTTLTLDKAAYLRLLHSSHQACVSIIQFLSDQIYQNGSDHRTRLFGAAEHALSGFLLAHAASLGEVTQAGTVLRIPINKSQIANSLGMSRRQIIRAFEILTKENLIEGQSGQLVILDVEALRRKAREPWEAVKPRAAKAKATPE
jgi:CRP-like cAMP-binding protein